MTNPLLPFYIYLTPLLNSRLYPHQDRLSAQQKQHITSFRSLVQQAVAAVFAQFRALGLHRLTYHGDNNQAIAQAIFSPEQIQHVRQQDDNLGGSDQVPFTLAGLPAATFAGNSTYYDRHPPAWSYPFDQKQDTIQLMNTYASGSSQKAQALTLSLAIPGMLTAWMLHQPAILGQASAGGNPIASISDVGPTQVKAEIALDARASFSPGHGSAPLHYAWDFGDGSTASGVSVSHTYTTAGTYRLTLGVTSAAGTLHVYKTLQVASRATNYANPYAQFPQNGAPPPNPAVQLPAPHDLPPGQVATASIPAAGTMDRLLFGIGIGLAIVLVALVYVAVRRSRGKQKV